MCSFITDCVTEFKAVFCGLIFWRVLFLIPPIAPNKNTRQRGSCMVWEINMGVCPRLDFENIMLFNCLGYNFNIYGVFEFLCNSIANL